MTQAPAPNWPGASNERAQTSPAGLMILGAVLFAVGCGSGFIVGWGAGLTNSFLGALAPDRPFGADIVVEAPSSVREGEQFELVVTVTDTSGEARMLATIDFYDDLCDDFEVISVTPEPSGFTQQRGYRETRFHTDLPAHSSVRTVFTLRATRAGQAVGDVEVYLDMTYVSDYETVTIDVR